MEVDYGEVELGAVDLLAFERRAVYTSDGMDLIGVDVMLDVLATYGPGGDPPMPSADALSGATVAELSGNDRTRKILETDARGLDPNNGDPDRIVLSPAPLETNNRLGKGPSDPSVWRSGPETDAELRMRLLRPRQKLIVWAYDRQTGRRIRWLESPRSGFVVDAAGGPFPVACDVISASGEPNAIGVRFAVKTRLSPCPHGSDRFVLTHRWEMTHTHDADFYATRVINGEIVFHQGVGDVIHKQPDLVRNQFIHPIPLGFQRRLGPVTQSSDGSTIRYQIFDTDPTIMFSPGDSSATQIDIQERHSITQPNPDVLGLIMVAKKLAGI